MTRRAITLTLAAVLALSVATGCKPAASEGQAEGPNDEVRAIRIGTLPTEDALPLWVAQQEGLFGKVGLTDVEITTFQSAQERDAALLAGSIDAFMGDLLAASTLESAGESVTVAFVMLGATPKEGRFGIVAAPGSKVTTLTQLANTPVGTSSNTIQEYVLDGLMQQAGVPSEQVKIEEVKKVPVRFDLLMNGQVAAAALPEPFLTLAEAQGAILLADDTTGENLSQTVLVVSDGFMRSGGVQTVKALMDAWDMGAQAVNADPQAWRELLVEQARLPEPIAETYEIQSYPIAQAPSAEQVDAVLDWMRNKDLITDAVTYESLVIVTP